METTEQAFGKTNKTKTETEKGLSDRNRTEENKGSRRVKKDLGDLSEERRENAQGRWKRRSKPAQIR